MNTPGSSTGSYGSQNASKWLSPPQSSNMLIQLGEGSSGLHSDISGGSLSNSSVMPNMGTNQGYPSSSRHLQSCSNQYSPLCVAPVSAPDTDVSDLNDRDQSSQYQSIDTSQPAPGGSALDSIFFSSPEEILQATFSPTVLDSASEYYLRQDNSTTGYPPKQPAEGQQQWPYNF